VGGLHAREPREALRVTPPASGTKRRKDGMSRQLGRCRDGAGVVLAQPRRPVGEVPEVTRKADQIWLRKLTSG
jgi:hypothetical protein